MTIQSNRRHRERYIRRHEWRPYFPAWHWPSWDRWGWGPRVTVVRNYDHPHRYRNMVLWFLAIVIILILASVITVSYSRK